MYAGIVEVTAPAISNQTVMLVISTFLWKITIQKLPWFSLQCTNFLWLVVMRQREWNVSSRQWPCWFIKTQKEYFSKRIRPDSFVFWEGFGQKNNIWGVLKRVVEEDKELILLNNRTVELFIYVLNLLRYAYCWILLLLSSTSNRALFLDTLRLILAY